MRYVHVVRPGDTLFAIAASYGLTVQDLMNANQLPNPENLVVGQALIIPATPLTYTVRRGDTLYTVALAFGVPLPQLIAANNIANPDLIFAGQVLTIPGREIITHIVASGETLGGIARAFGVPLELILRFNTIPNPNLILPGQRLNIPVPSPSRRTLATNGFILPMSLATARRILTPLSGLLTYISVFSATVDGQGGIQVPSYAPLVQAAREANIAPLAVLTNFQNGNFSPDLARMVFSSAAVRQATIDRYAAWIQEGGFAGAMVDFENMYPEDRPLYTSFINDIAQRMHSMGLIASIAVAPKWADFPNSPWIGAFDYAALGALVDFMYIMTYEWGWVGGPPQPVAPVNLVRRVLAYAVSLVPPARIMQGIPLYGYNWPLPDTPETLASTVDPQQAIVLAAQYGAVIGFDEVAQTPFFRYQDSTGRAHEVWFEDARSIQAKYQAAIDFGLMGAGYWQLSDDFPQNWEVLEEMFTVEKAASTG